MKKYILSLAIFAFVLSLLTVSASSARAYECEPGHLFSIFTGQRCGTTSNSNQNFDDLKIGSRGERVRAFQQMLKDGGFLYGKVDGIYGRITDSAAKNYYRIYPPTPINTNAPVIHGVSGPQTLNVNQKGTWTVTASDVVGGGSLSYTVTWGDEVYYYSGSTSASQRPAQQSATFSHSYANAGTYKPIFTVTNKYGQSAKTSLSVDVGNVNPPTPTDSITVLSPNGGENWLLGNTESIRWSDRTPTLLCVNCGNTYDVKIQATCTTSMCTEIYRPFMLIAKGVRGTSYSWTVGNTLDFMGSVTNGAYKIQVCQSGTSNCDLSDRYFTITSNATVGVPVISSISPNSGVVGTQVTIYGSGFTSTNNTIKFGPAWPNGGYINGINSNGTTINFTVPQWLSACDSNVSGACIASIAQVLPGSYSLLVTNANGTSNAVNFTVTSNTQPSSPTISYLSPTYGPVGTTVTITGSGFAATGNKIRFGNLGVENSPSYNNLSSSDGTHLTFTVPYSNYYACWDSYPACMIAARMTAPGVYPVSVIVNEKLTSNSVDFTVTQ